MSTALVWLIQLNVKAFGLNVQNICRNSQQAFGVFI